MNTGNQYYVYSHVSLKDGKCFYIGIGKNKRYIDGTSRNDYWHKEVESGGGYSYIILVNGISKKDAEELEVSFINQIGLSNLTNIDLGNKKTFNKDTINKIRYSLSKPVIYNGVVYEGGSAELSDLTGINRQTIYKRAKNNKKGFSFIEPR